MIKFLQNLLKGNAAPERSFGALGTDMHSHILPGLDDGAESMEQSLELVQAMQALGYRKLIMTPHVMGDFYKNTPEGIRERLQLLKAAAAEAGISMELACAAEYYLDEAFMQKLAHGNELLTFGDNCILFETSFMSEPLNLREAIFTMRSKGYTPVLAHPERYTYFYGRLGELAALREMGLLFQVNLNSLVGYYSLGARQVSERLVDEGLVDLLGSDVHGIKHVQALQKVLRSEYLQKALALPLRNNQL